MRNCKLYLSAVALAGLANLSLAAQQPSQSPSPSSPSQSALVIPDFASQSAPTQPASANAAPVQSTANSPEASNAQLRPVEGELEKKLDAKHARPGDPVVLKTTDEATIANGVIIPKGSKIVGHVVEAAAAGKGSANSKVTLQFDRAKLKGGQTLAIRTVLQSLAPESSSATAQDPAGPSGGAPMAAPAGGSAATPSSGMSGGSAAAPSVQADSTAQAGMAHGTNASAGSSAAVAGTVVARQGNVSIMTTAIPGVLIGASADGKPFSNAAGVLLGARQNVRLDGGTRIVLAVADAGAKPTNSR
jgi:hypothetical protein